MLNQDSAASAAAASRRRRNAATAELVNQAVAAHRQGRLAEAETLYREALARDPASFDALHLLGVIQGQRSAYGEAIALLSRALALRPTDAAAHCNLGMALRNSGRPHDAVASFDRALQLDPTSLNALCNRGHALRDLGDWEAAVASYDAALGLRADQIEALYHRADALARLDRLEEAVAAYDDAIRIRPEFPEAAYNRGNVLFHLGRLQEAFDSYDDAVRARPEEPIFLNNRGNALRGLGRVAEALESFERALAFKPDYPEALSNRGNALQALNRVPEALTCYDRAIALAPDFADAHCNRGAALAALWRLDEAVASYDRALQIAPDHAEVHNNRGTALIDLGRITEGLADYERALELKPDFADAHVNIGMALLLAGDFKRGWVEFDWRWRQASELAKSRPDLSGPHWTGRDSLHGKSILLWCEQGAGDSIQFCRFAPMLKAQGATVLLWTHSALESLMASLDGVDRVLKAGEHVPVTDFHCPLLSLPLALDIDPRDEPVQQRYLYADPERVAAWTARLGPRHRPRVGLAWSGNPEHKNDRQRSIPLERFIAIADGPFDFFCLQKDVREHDRPLREQRPDIGWFADELRDFEDTAALIQHMDVVIAVDTSVAHLAGALGRPVWVLLPHGPDWRWLLDRDDSPWYPAARLFRQPRFGDWQSVLQRVAQALSAATFPAAGPETDADPGPVRTARVLRARQDATAAALLTQAVDAHRQGRLDDAEGFYRQILAIVPGHFDALHMLGVLQAQRSNFPDAIDLIGHALALRPNEAAAHSNLGNALRGSRRPEEAVACYDRALQIDPAHADALRNRAHALWDLQRREEAVAAYEAALRVRPDDADLLYRQGTILLQLDRSAEALACYEKALQIRPDDVGTLNNRGNALRNLGRLAEALASFDRALETAPDDVDLLNNRGTVLQDLDRPEEALAALDRALQIQPEFIEAHYNRGTMLWDLERHQEALIALNRALQSRPGFIEAYYNRGNTLWRLNRLEEALADYDQVLAANPNHVDALNNRGTVLHDMKRPLDALDCYERVLALKPDDRHTLANAGMCRLLIGDFKRGWEGFEWRGGAADRPDLDRPRWHGHEPLDGKTILLWAEQGLGDTIQFSRFARLVAARGASAVLLSVPTALESLMTSLDGVTRVLQNGQPLPATDYYCPLPGLPLAFDIGLTTIPAEASYLRADPARVAIWADRLGPRRLPRIGLVWSGNPEHKNDRNRSIPLELYIRLAEGPFEFVCLQKEIRERDKPVLEQRPDIRTFCDELTDFADTAALVQNMDLVIAVDTSLAHLAGALGRPLWVLLPYVPDWRWLLDRDDSPWYPTARLFRQPGVGDWHSVVEQVGRELGRFVPVAPDQRGEVAGSSPAMTGAAGAAGAAAAAAAAAVHNGNELFRLGRFEDAVAAFDTALRIDPGNRDALYNRGNALFNLRCFADALAGYDEVLRLHSGDAKAHNNRGNALRELGRLQEALDSYDRALQSVPDDADHHGAVLQTSGRLEEAFNGDDRARTIATLCNRAVVLTDLRRPADALETYARVLALKPDHADAHVDAALCRLLAGDFQNGWADYEWRWRIPAFQSDLAKFAAPLWHGTEPLQGKTILLWCEQGLGDSIQFCRFATRVAAQGAEILLWTHAPLQTLMTSLEGVDTVLRAGDRVPATDFHCPLLSLPLALGTRLDSIPADSPYLHADPERIAQWGTRLGPRQHPRIGLAWSGNPDHRGDRNRSIALEKFLAIADGPFEFVCLQKHVRDPDRTFLRQRPDIRVFCDDLADFDDTAALVQHMDLVITVDTAVAHLAGALGRPVWTLLSFTSEWRWLLDRTDSPWYPTMRLFRQPQPGDWQSMFHAVQQALAATAFPATAAEVPAAESSPGALRATQQRRHARVARLLAQAATAHRAGGLAEAEPLYRQVLSLAPAQFDALHMLGVLQAQQFQYPQAIDTLEQALRIAPDNAAAHCNLGHALRGFGRPQDALLSYDRALGIDPGNADALCKRAHALRDLDRLEDALAGYDAALRLRPELVEALYHRGTTLFRLQRLPDALNSFGRVLQIDPNHIDALVNRGSVFLALQWPDDALVCFDRALRAVPDHVAALNGRGNALRRLHRLDEALASLDRAVQIAPGDAAAHANRGYVLEEQGRPQDALSSYEQALALRPDEAQVHVNAALCRLSMGDFQRGLPEFEWRWDVPPLKGTTPQHTPPRWTGHEPLAGKSILIWHEMGLGDSIQFCRFAKVLAARGASVVLGVPPLLAPLLSGVEGVARVETTNAVSPPPDYHCPLLSLPLALTVSAETIPAEPHYLRADAALTAAWNGILGERRTPRIGLVWSGNPAHGNDRNRSIMLERFIRIADGPFDFVSLQHEVRARDLPVLARRPDIRRFEDRLRDLQSMAALIANMDLVISVDTALAHLAGALGRPVWIMLPRNPDWRWFRDREDTPWYPAARLFRQPQSGDWQSVIDRVVHELGRMVWA